MDKKDRISRVFGELSLPSAVLHHVRTSSLGDGGDGNKCCIVWCWCRRPFSHTFAIRCERASELFLNAMQTSRVHAKSTRIGSAACFNLAHTKKTAKDPPKKTQRKTSSQLHREIHHDFVPRLFAALPLVQFFFFFEMRHVWCDVRVHSVPLTHFRTCVCSTMTACPACARAIAAVTESQYF